jgi:hypothetical protein
LSDHGKSTPSEGDGVLFLFQQEQAALFTLSSLMPRPGQQLSVLMASHFLSALFDDAAHYITSFHLIY